MQNLFYNKKLILIFQIFQIYFDLMNIKKKKLFETKHAT